MSVAPGDCNPTRAVCRFIAQSRARTGSFCGSVKGRPASLYVGWVSEAHPPGLAINICRVGKQSAPTRPGDSTQPWLIPAHAGNTFSPHNQRTGKAVYPRSRGEHDLPVFLRREITGLSPLARGTHADLTLPDFIRRFIPARAGNTVT